MQFWPELHYRQLMVEQQLSSPGTAADGTAAGPDDPAGPHSDPVVLGKRLRHFRTRARLTLAQLADATGTTASQLSHIENGRREPRLSLLQALARTLGVSAGDLLEDAPPPDRRAALEIELHQAQS